MLRESGKLEVKPCPITGSDDPLLQIWVVPQTVTTTSQKDSKAQEGSASHHADLEDIQNMADMSLGDKGIAQDILQEPELKKPKVEPKSPEELRQEEFQDMKSNAQRYLRRYQDLEIETKCLVTKIQGSENQRKLWKNHASLT